jgi:hypothetical protein
LRQEFLRERPKEFRRNTMAKAEVVAEAGKGGKRSMLRQGTFIQ